MGSTYIEQEETEESEKKTSELAKSSDIEALKSLFKIALEKRDFEITQLVQRNNFFMIFQGVLFAGIMQSSHQKPLVTFLVCLAGLLVSIFQVGMASGAKFWQEYWEEALKKIEDRLLMHIHKKDESRREIWSLFHDRGLVYSQIVKHRLGNHKSSFLSLTSWLVMKRFSVSRIPIYVGISFSLIWLLMLFASFEISFTGIQFRFTGLSVAQ